MTTLEEARDWYLAASKQLRLMQRIGLKHWSALPWDGPLGDDDRLREVEEGEIARDTEVSLAPLDDLAVVVMFSVFEATVRQAVLRAIEPETADLEHPALRHAVSETEEGIREGSFFRVLEPYKAVGLADLVEEVNQVRRYRNWVAHGRRGVRPASVNPQVAYERLARFLDQLQTDSEE